MATDILDILVRERGSRVVAGRLTEVSVAGSGAERAVMLLNRALGVLATGALLRSLAGYADSFTRIQNQIQIAGIETDRTAEATARLLAISNETRTQIEGNAILFGKLGQTQAELGVSTEKLYRFTQLVGKGFAIQATNAAGVRGATIQLTQAMGEGIVRAQEFNSIIENNRPLLVAAAQGIDEAGGSIAKLRAIMKEGELTSERFFSGVIRGGQVLDDLFAKTTPTIGQAFSVLGNNITVFIGKLDRLVGASELIATSIIGLGNNLEDLAPAVILTGTIILSRLIGPAIAGFAKATASTLQYYSAVASGRAVVLGSATAELQRAESLAASAKAETAAAAAQVNNLQVKRSVLKSNLELIAAERTYNLFVQEGTRARNIATGQFVSLNAATRRQNELDREALVTRRALRITETELAAARNLSTAAVAKETVAQTGLSLALSKTTIAARAAAVAGLALRGTLAFLGGPVGAAITAITVGMLAFGARTRAADRLIEQLNENVRELGETFKEVGGNVDLLKEKLEDITLTSALAQAQRFREELESTTTVLASSLGKITFQPIDRAFQVELLKINQELFNGSENFEKLREALDKVATAHPELVPLLDTLQNMTNKALGLRDGAEKAEAMVRVLSGTASDADRALLGLSVASEKAAGSLGILEGASAAAKDELRGLIDFIPRLKEVAEQQEDIFEANKIRSEALATLNAEQKAGNVTTLEAIAGQERINRLYTEAISEIDGTAEAQREATESLDDYLSDSRTAGLTGRARALEAEKRSYEELVSELVAAKAPQEALNKAEQAHEQNLINIGKQYDDTGKRGSEYRKGLKTEEGFVADLNRRMKEEIELLSLHGTELAVTTELYKELQSARQKDVELSNAQVEAIKAQLEILAAFRAQAEVVRGAHGALDDYTSILQGATLALENGLISVDQFNAAVGSTALLESLRDLDKELFGSFGAGLEAQIEQFKVAEAEKLVIVQQALDARILSEEQAADRIAQIHAQTAAQIQQATAVGYGLILTNASNVFGEMASLVENSMGRQSAAFKGLFLASKAFALANAIVQTSSAITTALASGPPPYNYIQAAIVAAQGGIQIGTIIAQTIQGFVDGGMVGFEQTVRQNLNGKVRGVGGPKDDKILARVSNGEFIVNSDATAKNFDLLTAINEGRNPDFGFKDGGAFARGARESSSRITNRERPSSAPVQQNSYRVNVNLGNNRAGSQEGRNASQIAKAIAAELRAVERRDGQ